MLIKIDNKYRKVDEFFFALVGKRIFRYHPTYVFDSLKLGVGDTGLEMTSK